MGAGRSGINGEGPPFATPDFKQERTYLQGSAYALMATGLPFIESDKHRLLTSIHGGIGKDLDRFSAFRLAGRPLGMNGKPSLSP